MKVLIVDDIKGWRDYHSAIIKNIFPDVEIQTAESATLGYDKLLENNEYPFDLILTDMQMENDFDPKYAGEWFIEQVKSFKNYNKTKIVIISATYNIETIASHFGVEYLRKSTARNFVDSYEFLRQIVD